MRAVSFYSWLKFQAMMAGHVRSSVNTCWIDDWALPLVKQSTYPGREQDHATDVLIVEPKVS